MKYLIALFTSKVVIEQNGRSIYIDPISKNGYKLKGKLAKQSNLLPMRVAIAIFGYLVLYSLMPNLFGFPTEILFALITFLALLIFEVRLYTKILPSCSIYPNYVEPTKNKVAYSKNKNILLLISYIVFLVVLILYCIEKKQLSSIIGSIIIGIVVVIRTYQIIENMK